MNHFFTAQSIFLEYDALFAESVPSNYKLNVR